MINCVSGTYSFAHLPTISPCLLVDFASHVLAEFRRFNYLAIDAPTSDPGDKFFDCIDFCVPKQGAIKLRLGTFRGMPVTLAHPPFNPLAEAQRNRCWFVFFVEPYAPRAPQ